MASRPDGPGGLGRAFLVYTGARLGLFAVVFVILVGVGLGGVLSVAAAFVASGLLSYVLLDRQRRAFALRLEQRRSQRRVIDPDRVDAGSRDGGEG